jgi:predicted ATPase
VKGCVILIDGEAGSGKSVLLAGLRDRGWNCLDMDATTEALQDTCLPFDHVVFATNANDRPWSWFQKHRASSKIAVAGT